MSRSITNLKISISGVRGVVGETLTPRLISNFAAAFGHYIGPGPIIIGRDTRPTGPMVEQAVIAGLLAVGCQPVLAGILPTPSIQLMVSDYNAVGGICITASHNPMEWNALKLINERGMFLNGSEAREVLNIYNQSAVNDVRESSIPRIKEISEAFAIHQEKIYSKVDMEKIAAAEFKVAVDCINGAGAPYAPDFLSGMGCDVSPLFIEPDGKFRRKPEPVPEALTELCKSVKENNCAVGFAQDPDADRLVLVDDKGRALNENLTLALAVKHILKKTPGPVTVNLATSKVVQHITDLYDCPLFYTKIGEINVSTEMLKNRSVIGGEANGGVIWPDIHPCRDSFAGMALILELLADSGRKLSELVDELPSFSFGSRKIPCSSEKAAYVMKKLKKLSTDAQIMLIDGIRFDWEDRWIIIRPSNTEPLMRVQGEADNPRKLEHMLNEFEHLCINYMEGRK